MGERVVGPTPPKKGRSRGESGRKKGTSWERQNPRVREKWGKEREAGEMGTDGSGEHGVRKQGERTTEEQAVRVAREEKEVEEWSADPAGKETERKRVRESWKRPWGRERAGGRGRRAHHIALTCSATSRTDWTLVP